MLVMMMRSNQQPMRVMNVFNNLTEGVIMSNIMKQSDSVVFAVIQVVGAPTGKVTLTKDQFKQVCDIVAESIWDGTTDMSESGRAKYDTAEKVRKGYTPGLVNNHLRKHKALNGGIKYVSKPKDAPEAEATELQAS